ncbi:MAG: glycosyltransferase family 2 protein [Bacillota bacterium]
MDWLEPKKVSVIITCHNYGQYLQKAIESVFDQTYSNIEVIAVNDGSTDNTMAVLGNYRSKVKVVHNPSPCGCGVARNQGIELAGGELCLFLDADDYLDPYYLERTVPLISQPGVGIVYCSFWQVFPQHRVKIQTLPYQRRVMLTGNLMAITSLTRTNLVQLVGGLDNRLLLQDYDLWIRITQITGAIAVLEPLFYQVMHGDNMNLTMPETRRREELNRIRKRTRYGIFFKSRNEIYLITGALLRHHLPEGLMHAAGLDQNDIFEVSGEVLASYREGMPLDSPDAMAQVAYRENRW